MEDLILRLRIEEDNRGSKRKYISSERANMVEHGQGSKFKKNYSGKGTKLAPKGGISKQSKFERKCYNWRAIGLLTAESQRIPTRRRKQTWWMVSPMNCPT